MKKLFILPLIAVVTFTLAGCTTPSTQQTEQVIATGNTIMYNADSWKEIINDSCQSFNDGCNQCTKTGTGGEAACTKMSCQTYSQPYCTDENKVVSTAAVEYIGLTTEQAQKLATDNNTPFRVVEIDGKGQAVTADYIVGRINASTKDGIITSINVEGSDESAEIQ